MQGPRAETMVRVYRGTKDYRKDAERQARQGWQVVGVTQQGMPAGCLVRVFFWWIPGALSRLTEYTVTYSRLRPPG